MSSRTRTWRLLGVPIDCIARQGGTELAPDALRAGGLVARARLEDVGDAQTRLRTPERDSASGLVAAEEVFSVTRELYRLVGRPRTSRTRCSSPGAVARCSRA
jgi:hypothetical protein